MDPRNVAVENSLRQGLRLSTPAAAVSAGAVPAGGGSRGSREVSQARWRHRSCAFDLMAEKRIGFAGKFVLVAPVEMFDSGSMGDLYATAEAVYEQMDLFVLRLAQYAVRADLHP